MGCKIKIFFLVFIAFIICGSSAVQKEGTQVQHPYFWEVEKEGKTSYLLGTMHEPVPIDDLLCGKDIRHHLENSDLVFVETDFYSERSKEVVDTQKQWMQSADGREFRAFSSKSQEFLRSKGISERLNLYGYVIILGNLCGYGVSSIEGLTLTEQVTDIARSKEILVRELDDFEEKLAPIMRHREKIAKEYAQLSNTKFSEVIHLLDQYIHQFNKQCPLKNVVDTIENYKSGLGVWDMLEIFRDLSFLDRSKYVAELERRNGKWVDHFEEANKNHAHIFLAVGLAHLFDLPSLLGMGRQQTDLVSMLKNRGYTVESVICEK